MRQVVEKIPVQSLNETIAKTTATEKPLVSAIIPTYNRAAMLARAIRSVQQQTYSHLEIIVIDDASQDNTREIVASFADPRIRYIRHDSNKGGSATRNTGIRAATGNFIAFLDDDDEWVPEKTEEQLKYLQDYAAVICTSYPIRKDFSTLSSTKTVELADLLQKKFTWGGTGILMAQASVLKETKFDETLPRYQDWDLFIRLALRHKIAYLNKPLKISRSDDHPRITNSIVQTSLSELEQQLRMVHKHKELFGRRWFRRHMCKGLLYGVSHRQDKIALLAYTARRYGFINVARVLALRVGTQLRKSFAGRFHRTPEM